MYKNILKLHQSCAHGLLLYNVHDHVHKISISNYLHVQYIHPQYKRRVCTKKNKKIRLEFKLNLKQITTPKYPQKGHCKSDKRTRRNCYMYYCTVLDLDLRHLVGHAPTPASLPLQTRLPR